MAAFRGQSKDWCDVCSAVLRFLGFCFVPFRSRPPHPVYVNATPKSTSSGYPPDKAMDHAPSCGLPEIPATVGLHSGQFSRSRQYWSTTLEPRTRVSHL